MNSLFARALAVVFLFATSALHAQVADRRAIAQDKPLKSIAGMEPPDVSAQLAVRIAPGAGPAYLLPVMRHATNAGSETLGMMYTVDDFATLHDLASGDMASGAGGLRDPCLFQVNGTWYCACTLNAWVAPVAPPGTPPPHSIRILTSTDLVTWTVLVDVPVTNSVGYTWAPKFFYDQRTNRVFLSVSAFIWDISTHTPFIASASLDDLTTWSAWTQPAGLPAAGSIFIDFQIATDGIHYYATGAVSGSAPSLAIYRSTTIDSGYTLFSSFDFGEGIYAEQCWLEWMGGTKWSMCYNVPSTYKTYRRTSLDGMATWSAPVQINDYITSNKSFACPYLLKAAPVPGQPGQPGQMRVIFSPIEAGCTYTVKYRSDLSGGTWLPVLGTMQSDNGTERTVTDFNATGAQKFYQIEITKP